MITISQRKHILLALIVLFVLGLFLIWFFLFKGSVEEVETVVPVDVQSSKVQDETSSITNLEPITADAANARTVASNFVERYGTYSTDNPFANVREVKELVTPEFYADLTELVTETENGGEFFGTTVNVLAVSVASGGEELGSMVYKIDTQVESQLGSRANSKVTYRSGETTLEKRGDLWLVNSFKWTSP